mmetsp:Transcript_37870/g.61564  ORF Transcript_37870/g.61564 Transcript_37870/m.61564 type:complete len:194 (+) Transcript_37870:91-672(+)
MNSKLIGSPRSDRKSPRFLTKSDRYNVLTDDDDDVDQVQKDSKLNTSRGKIDQQHIHQSSPDSGVPKYLAKHINSKISNEIPSLLLTYGKRENWFVPSADIKMENKPIAAGNCAQIYRGFFRGIQVVIKQITDRENQHDVKDIRREIALWRTLRHPNIVMFLGASFHPMHGERILMEYMFSGNLTQKMRNKSN